MGGKAASGSVVNSSTTNQISSAAALVTLRNADGLLALYTKNKGSEKSGEDIKSRLHNENWIQSVFLVINDSKTSLADLRFLSKVFEKIVHFIVSDPSPQIRDAIKPVLLSQKADFDKFLNELSRAEIPCYGASLWLAYCKLFVTVFGTKMPSKEWNDLFTPMETWFKISDEEAVKICLQAWTSFISFAGPKLSTGMLREKLLATFTKPLRSHAVMNKLKTSAPIISAYTALISAFRNSVDDRFEELIICFLRFLIGSSVVALEDVKTIENEIARPFSQDFKLVLEGATSNFLDYLTDSRTHRVFEDAPKHIFPLICSVLGIKTSKQGIPVCANIPSIMLKYGIFLAQVVRFADQMKVCETDANSICLCFAALGRRIEAISDEGARRRESRFLFIQIRAWIAESSHSIEDIESALCQLFRGGDLSVHANTVGEWPAMKLVEAILKRSRKDEQDTKKPSTKLLSEFLEIIPGTLRGGLETEGIVLKRLGELCEMVEGNLDCFDAQSVLKTWSHMADMLTEFIKETDDANEGSVLEPDFSKTFNLLKLVFKIANHVDKEVSAETLTQCSSAFSRLYAEIQTTVSHEFNCSAETVLHGVFGSADPPETISSIHLFTTSLLYVVNIYPFESITEKEVFSGSTVEFNALGEMTIFVNTLQLLGEKILSSFTMDKAEKIPRSLPKEFLSILVISQKLFAAVEKPSLIRTLFLAMSGLLAKMLGKIYSDDSLLKGITQDSLVAFSAIVESLQSKIPGPFDDSLLSNCAPLLTTLLSGRRGRSSKLRVAALDLWKNTFAKAQSLTYSKDLREALLPLVKKRVINVPGFSKVNDFNGDAPSSGEELSFTTSPSNSSQLSSRPRRTRKSVKMEEEDPQCNSSLHSSPLVAEMSSSQIGKKRSKAQANVDEDTDTPIAKVAKKATSTPEENGTKPSKTESTENTRAPVKSPKAEQVTPRQSVTPRTKRRVYVGLLDEDSVDYVPIISSESAKKMKLTDRQREMFSEKRDRMPFLDEDSQNSAVIAHLPSEFDAEMSQSTSNNPTKLASMSCSKSGDDQIESQQEDMLPQKDVPSVSPVAEVKVEDSVEDNTSSRRKPKLKLNFDEAGTCEHAPFSLGSDESLEKEKIDSTEKASELSGQPGNSSVDDAFGSDESTGVSVDSATENVENSELSCSRRSRKKGTPLKYVGQKKRESNKIVEKEQKTPSTPKKGRRSSKIVQERLGDVADSKTLPPIIQDVTTQQTDDTLVLREMDDVFNVTAPNNGGLDESLDENDDVTETPEKQNAGVESIAATPTPAFVQRIAGTPGILKKVDSPSTAEKKLRRVHFGGTLENNALDVTTDDPLKAITSNDLIPVSPKGIVKRATPRRPFFHLQTTVDQVSKVAALPNESIAASPVKSEADAATFTDDEPIFPRLADCRESIGRIVGRLLPLSSTNGAIAARKSLEAQGIVKICDLASKSRREVSLLNIKKPRIETALRTLSQFARDHFKAETSPIKVISEELLLEPVEVQEDVVLEALEQTGTATSFTVVISESSEAELEVAGSNKMDPVEIHPVSEKYVEHEYLAEVKTVEMEEADMLDDHEKKRLFEAVRETFRCVQAEMDDDGASADLERLRRAASKAARALLDVVSWCDEATP